MSKRLAIDGYGQLELNQVAFRRDGRIEAQCKIASGIDYVENGMLLAVNKAAGTVGYPTGAANELIGLNYSAEVIYDERTQGLKYYKTDKDSFLPRLGYLAVGDRFTTNCLAIASATGEKATKAEVEAAIDGGCIYGVPDLPTVSGETEIPSTGAIKLVNTPGNAGVVLQVVAKTTMPDGQFAVKFVVVKA